MEISKALMQINPCAFGSVCMSVQTPLSRENPEHSRRCRTTTGSRLSLAGLEGCWQAANERHLCFGESQCWLRGWGSREKPRDHQWTLRPMFYLQTRWPLVQCIMEWDKAHTTDTIHAKQAYKWLQKFRTLNKVLKIKINTTEVTQLPLSIGWKPTCDDVCLQWPY